jgi:hypothetical protein
MLCTCPIGGIPLCSQYPILFELCTEKNITIKELVDKRGEIGLGGGCLGT